MTRRIRTILFAIAAVALAWTFLLLYSPIAPLGSGSSTYGDVVNAITVPERHMTDAVTAVNFDIRGFDTLGEEFILFTSVIGTVLLMRRQKQEPAGDHEDHIRGRIIPNISDAVRITALLLIGPTVLFGIDVVAHGQLTPGGGFQGGVIVASAPVLLYLCAEYAQFRKALPPRLVEISEGIGAAAYILIGAACAASGALFLQNVLPLGKIGSIASGGIVPLIDLSVGLEVSGGLCLAFLAYLEELMEEKE